jgi:isopentenyl phosphate kinase
MSECILLKLGGSVITDKKTDCAINYDQLSFVASAISRARRGGMVIIHGAGSCGHPEAKQYRLNDEVVATLREKGVAAVGVHPLHAAVADKGRLVAFEHRHLEQMLMLNMVPVIHGDVVMDLSRGACIVSGDQLVRYLAVALNINRVGLATDVPGVLNGGLVVPEITRDHVTSLQIGNSMYTDVTGGMRGKINELLGLASAGIGSDILVTFLQEPTMAGQKLKGINENGR